MMQVGPSVRAKILQRRTYNRPLNEEGTIFETWEETIRRVRNHQQWLWERAQGDSLTQKQNAELEELEQLMLNRMVAPAGRTLWLGGTELVKRREASMFNPCRRTTKFITTQGIKSFEDFKNGDIVVVLTHLGNWMAATVVDAGIQPVNKITFRHLSNTYVEYFTPTHTWILRDGTRTNNLQIGAELFLTPDHYDDLTFDGIGVEELTTYFKVESIEPQGEENVWCLNVEDDHSFVLWNGIVTGNCSFSEVRTVHDVVDVFWLLLQGCFPPDATVWTENGLRRIDSIKEGDLVWSRNYKTDLVELKPVIATHDLLVHKDENIKITGHFGSITTSIRHPIQVLNEENVWVKKLAGDIVIGDILRKICVQESEVKHDIKAWFAGVFLGDGCSDQKAIGSRRIRIVGDNKQVVNSFAGAVACLSGDIAVKIKKLKRKDYKTEIWHIEKTLPKDNQLVIDWKEIVGDLPNKKTLVIGVPNWIKCANDPTVFFSFLSGLIDTDGYLDKQNYKAYISTSSKTLIDDLMQLCPVYGLYPWTMTIDTEKYASYSKNGYRPTGTQYRIHFTYNDIKNCHLQHELKAAKLSSYKAGVRQLRKKLIIPQCLIDSELSYLGIQDGIQRQKLSKGLEKRGTCYADIYVTRNKDYSHLLQYDRVISIARNLDITEDFKDITVADNHNYFCGNRSLYGVMNCGCGYRPVSGSLSGFTRKMEVQIIRSTRTDKGRENNTETYDPSTKTWTISIGDSAEAWAKSIGKIVAGKFPAKKLVIDLQQIRPSGTRLKGYGWICSGDRALAQALEAICVIMNRQAGKLLSKIDILDLINWLGTVLSSRRSALITLMDYGDPEWYAFATAKAPAVLEKQWHRSQSNNSLVFWEKPTPRQMKDLFDMIISHGGAEPGFINAQQAIARAPWWQGFNPCLTGGTKVAVADGRGSVEMAILVADGKDVPVYCIDNDDQLTVRTLRNPRKTGTKVKILRVTFDNNDHIRVTENHKFRLKTGKYVEAKDLRKGNSLDVMHRFRDLNARDYNSLMYNEDITVEHNLVASYKYGVEITDDNRVVHINGDNNDNKPDNLSIITTTDEVTNEALLSHGRTLTESLEHKFTVDEWQTYAKQNKLPQYFSTWRRQTLGSINAFAGRCAQDVGIKDKTPDNQVIIHLNNRLKDLIDQGYDAELIDTSIFVNKECMYCGKAFQTEQEFREVSYCSARCGNNFAKLAKFGADLPEKYKPGSISVLRTRQINLFNKLKVKLDRVPSKKEFEEAWESNYKTKVENVRSWFEFKLAAAKFNHRVKSVVEDGYEDVYNGTVDDVHNFFVGGWETTTSTGRKCSSYVNNKNCGEILLANKSFCNLVELSLPKFKDDHLAMHNAMRLIARCNYRQTMVNLRDGILSDSWHQGNEFLRLCGVSCSGIAQRQDLTAYDYKQLRNTAISGCYAMAYELNSERPKNVTTVKPSGSISKILDVSEGVHVPLSRYIFNNILFSRHDPLVAKLFDANYTIVDHPNDPDSVLIALPVNYDGIKFDNYNGMEVNRESAITQLERYKLLNNNYVDHNCSITVSYDPSEVKQISTWLLNNWENGFVSVSFLFRNDPTKTAKELGFSYLPQNCVTRETYDEYVNKLLPVDIDNVSVNTDVPLDTECANGCPIR